MRKVHRAMMVTSGLAAFVDADPVAAALQGEISLPGYVLPRISFSIAVRGFHRRRFAVAAFPADRTNAPRESDADRWNPACLLKLGSAAVRRIAGAIGLAPATYGVTNLDPSIVLNWLIWRQPNACFLPQAG